MLFLINPFFQDREGGAAREGCEIHALGGLLLFLARRARPLASPAGDVNIRENRTAERERETGTEERGGPRKLRAYLITLSPRAARSRAGERERWVIYGTRRQRGVLIDVVRGLRKRRSNQSFRFSVPCVYFDKCSFCLVAWAVFI